MPEMPHPFKTYAIATALAMLIPCASAIAQTCNPSGFEFKAPVDGVTLTGNVVVAGVVHNACPISAVSLLYDCWAVAPNSPGPSWKQIETKQPNNVAGADVSLLFNWDSNTAPRGQNLTPDQASYPDLSSRNLCGRRK
jgi:hypothetical protein